MSEEILNLLKLLAKDDNFASNFENAKSIEEKYDLAKSKFESLQKDDFIKFMQEFQIKQLELNEEKLREVSGGVDKKSLVTKIAALSMLGVTFGSMSNICISNAKGVEIVYSEKIDSNSTDIVTSKNDTSLARKLWQCKNLIKGIVGDDGLKIIVKGPNFPWKKEFTMDDVTSEHIILGDWNITMSYGKEQKVLPILQKFGCTSGGHTELSSFLLDMNTEFKDKVKKHNFSFSFFKEEKDLTKENFNKLLNIIKTVLEKGKCIYHLSKHGNNVYDYKIDNMSYPVRVVVDEKNGKIITAFPLDQKSKPFT